jgi:hypothetical protein
MFITGVNDTSDKLFSGVNDTGEKFIEQFIFPGVIDTVQKKTTNLKFIAGVNNTAKKL